MTQVLECNDKVRNRIAAGKLRMRISDLRKLCPEGGAWREEPFSAAGMPLLLALKLREVDKEMILNVVHPK